MIALKTWNEKFKWVKENLNLILIIPTVIGGFWQIIELARISTAYIRFFSITQVIPDGLLILFVISMFVGSYYIAGFFLKLMPFYRNEVTNWKQSISIYIFIVVFTILNILGLCDDYMKFGQIKIFGIIAVIFNLTFLIKTLPLSLPNSIRLKLIAKIEKRYSLYDSAEREIPIWKGLTANIFIIMGFSMLMIMLGVFSDLRNNYINTENLLNIDNLKSEIFITDKNKKFENIIYSNDKYYFIQLKDKKGNEYVRVLKVETLFNRM